MKKLLFLTLLAVAAFELFAPAAPAQDKPAPAPASASTSAPTPAAPAPVAPMVERARIDCDGKVKTDGVVDLVVTPQGGTPMRIRVTLQKKMKANEICHDVAKELSVALGEKFDVDEDGASVEIKAEGKDEKFSLVLGTMTATGASVDIKLK